MTRHTHVPHVSPRSRAPLAAASLLALLLTLLLGTATAQGGTEDDPIAIRVEIFIVSEVPTDGGDTSEQYTEATSARPGQVVEYRLFATNQGETTLPGGTVVLTGPVPDGTRFVPASATPSSDRIITEYTGPGAVDESGDQVFSQPPVLATVDGEVQAIDPSEFTAVRWTLLEPMAPGQEEAFFYRVVVE